MERTNRIAVSLTALFLLVAAVVTFLVAIGVLATDFLPGGSVDRPSDSWFNDQLRDLAGYDGAAKAVTVVVTLLVVAAMLAVLFIETVPSRRRQILPISMTSEGALTIEASSVTLLAERTGITNRNVSALRCRLVVRTRPISGPASIVLACYPRVILGSDLQEIRDDLQTRIKESVQQLTGLNVLRVNVVNVKFGRGDDSRLMAT